MFNRASALLTGGVLHKYPLGEGKAVLRKFMGRLAAFFNPTLFDRVVHPIVR
jgi:hypothetical protein